MHTFADYANEVLAGFQKCERERMDRARRNYDFFRGDFERYSSRPRVGIYQSAQYERNSLIMQRIVDALTKHLYGRGPARSLPEHEEASLWLNAQYTREGIDSTFQEADRLACVGDVAAIQVAATDDPARPIRFHLWPAHQIVPFESEEDPTLVEAIAVIDFFDQRRRVRLWSAEEFQEFQTNRGDGTTGGTAYYPVGPAEEHGLGVLPFAFVHFNPPNCEFWSGGPGDHLAQANDYINFFLTEIGDSIRYCAKPIVKAFGVRDGWTPPTPGGPGDVWTIPPAYLDGSGNGIEPAVEPFQFDLGFVESAWMDAQAYIDHTLECNNCPPAEIRMEQSGTKSGVALIQEQMPLVIRAQGRQRSFLRYERNLARVALAVGSAVTSLSLNMTDSDNLTLRWPSLIPDIPGASADQDLADLESLKTGQTSRVMIAMRKYNFTREEAIAHLKAIAEDLAEELTLGLPPIPSGPAVQAGPEPAADSKLPNANEPEKSTDGED